MRHRQQASCRRRAAPAAPRRRRRTCSVSVASSSWSSPALIKQASADCASGGRVYGASNACSARWRRCGFWAHIAAERMCCAALRVAASHLRYLPSQRGNTTVPVLVRLGECGWSPHAASARGAHAAAYARSGPVGQRGPESGRAVAMGGNETNGGGARDSSSGGKLEVRPSGRPVSLRDVTLPEVSSLTRAQMNWQLVRRVHGRPVKRCIQCGAARVASPRRCSQSTPRATRPYCVPTARRRAGGERAALLRAAAKYAAAAEPCFECHRAGR